MKKLLFLGAVILLALPLLAQIQGDYIETRSTDVFTGQCYANGEMGLTGKEAEETLGKVGITVNKNAIPFDTESPFKGGGIRIGSPAATTRGAPKRAIRVRRPDSLSGFRLSIRRISSSLAAMGCTTP